MAQVETVTTTDVEEILAPPPPTNQHQQSASTLCNLPREIRKKIWKEALTIDEPVLWPTWKRKIADKLGAGLLATCKQIYEEAGEELYQNNAFEFKNPSDLNVFRFLHDHNNRDKIKDVTFYIRERDLLKLWIPYFASSEKIRGLVFDLPNVQKLNIYLEQRWWHLGQDPAANLHNWHLNRGVRQLCMALERRTPAVVHVLDYVHVPSSVYDALVSDLPDKLKMQENGALRTSPVEYFSAFVTLELSTPRSAPVDIDFPWTSVHANGT